MDGYDFRIGVDRDTGGHKFQGGYSLAFYFNLPVWAAANVTGTRVLQRVELNGSHTADGVQAVRCLCAG